MIDGRHEMVFRLSGVGGVRDEGWRAADKRVEEGVGSVKMCVRV